MNLSVFVPPWGPTATLDEIESLVDAAEHLGYHGLWVGDHVVFPRSITSTYPYGDSDPFPFLPDELLLEPVSLLAFVAGRTSRITIGTSVLVLPLRNPVTTAKMLATIDVLSAGRLVAGVGAGWLSEEFDALDADFTHRGAVTDEWIDIMHRLWNGSTEGFSGRHYKFDPLGFVPTRPKIPIVVGGNSRAARRRAARADGWHPLRLEPKVLADGIAEARAMAAAHHRSRQPFRIVYRDSLMDQATMRAGPGRLTSTAVAQVDRRLATSALVGVDELVVEFPDLTTGERLAWMSWIADHAGLDGTTTGVDRAWVAGGAAAHTSSA
jgi:probable F420-dependent oxidoreductase